MEIINYLKWVKVILGKIKKDDIMILREKGLI